MKIISAVFGSLLLIGPAVAQDPAPAATPEATPAKRSTLKYTPPKSANGGARIDGDGGSRGSDLNLPALYVLAPSGAAMTTHAQPSLFYFQAGPAPKGVPCHFKVTLLEPKQTKPLLKINLPVEGALAEPGIRRIQLGRQNISLKPGVRYTWSVAFGPNSGSGSSDVVASGSIEYTEPSAELSAALAKESTDKAGVYAAHGIWYEALEEIANGLTSDPKNPALLAQRSELLLQVGLKSAAAFK